jgi:hypothetical protein
MPRLAICFFGLVKNIDHVYDSIRRYILDPLTYKGYEFDFYGHTYKMDRFTNPRNGEANVPIHSESIHKRFKFKQFKMHSINDYPHLNDDLQLCLKYGDPWPENKILSLKNHLLNLWSLYQVTQLWKNAASTYASVIYLRPDLRFLNPLEFQILPGKSLAVPSFHSYGGHNDRFAYGTPSAMIIYGERWAGMKTYFNKHKRSIHSETFLQLYLQDNGVQTVAISIKFQRIRATGQPHPGDRRL